jgi:hypothetical protein
MISAFNATPYHFAHVRANTQNQQNPTAHDNQQQGKIIRKIDQHHNMP